MHKGHQLRQGRHSITGACYLITITTQRRQPTFTVFEHACSASRHFYHPRVLEIATTLSFVVMPDHIHWLLQLNGNLSEAIRRYKTYVSLDIGQRIWQDGFHDRMIRQEESLKGVARYIVANPLRANLVNDIIQYSYWDAAWL
ncbi:MAG: REP-associated tyrosine transposase [Vreelandella alkaliphila]